MILGRRRCWGDIVKDYYCVRFPPPSARRHEERVVGSSHSFTIVVKPVEGTGGTALCRERQSIHL